MIPQAVSASEASSLSLWRESAREFRVVQAGPLRCMIEGFDFILATRELADLLVVQCLGDVSSIDVAIRRQHTSETWSSHVELLIERNLVPDSLPLSDLEEGRAWCFNRSGLFVHPSVGAVLAAAGFALELSSGFQRYAGRH